MTERNDIRDEHTGGGANEGENGTVRPHDGRDRTASAEAGDSRRPQTLPLVALDDAVVLPGMTVTLVADAGESRLVVLVPRRGGELGRIGTLARVEGRALLPVDEVAADKDERADGAAADGALDDRGGAENERHASHAQALVLRGIERAEILSVNDEGGRTASAVVVPRPDGAAADDPQIEKLAATYRAVVDEILELVGDDGRIRRFVAGVSEPGALADTIGLAPELTLEQRLALLETVDVAERLELAVELARKLLVELQVRRDLREEVERGAQRQQREYVLRKQLESIRRELGEDDASVVEEYRRRIAEAQMPDAVREQAERELARLERSGEATGEASMIRTYLDWLLAVPWGKRSQERLDPDHARAVLDRDHAGLDDVKQRVVEHIAVRKLRRERGIQEDRRSGAILTLVGPPGTGKTSIGESIARATGRKCVRIALGGVRDEAEIRGHRRTYIGALPGRIVRALRDAGTMNPVVILDEVDKIGVDWRGDPSAALLEVLDPAQNHSFRDHYLDVDVDLSDVLFIATANVAETIPAPLLDRMEIVRFDGYTTAEKVTIARGYLWPRQLERHGLRGDEVAIEDDLLRTIVTDYTREAGVRQLEREIGKLLRKTATAIADGSANPPVRIDEAALRAALGRPRYFQETAERTAIPGVAAGLSVTHAGGDVLFVEATAMPAAGSGGALVLTGQLGDVMKESARIALSYVRANHERLGIPATAFEARDFHIHVPAGAIPKDGPSAGVTIVAALVSLLSGRPVRPDVGMTGEVTLRGRVLPVGGIKQKVLAAHAAGIRDVIIPERNRADLDDVPAEVRRELRIHPVMTIDEALELALEPQPTTAVTG